MNCRHVRSLLSAYIDSELTGRQMLFIRDHLSTCNECADERDSLQSLKQMLCALAQKEPNAVWSERLDQHINTASLPFYERVIATLTQAGFTQGFSGRRLASAAMISAIGVFLASSSFDHNVVTSSSVMMSSAGPFRFHHVQLGSSFLPMSFGQQGTGIYLEPTPDAFHPYRDTTTWRSMETVRSPFVNIEPQTSYNNLTLASFPDSSYQTASSH